MTCCNCKNKAVYTVADPGVNPLDYCNNCLPKHLQARAKAGQFAIAKPAKVETPKAEAPKEEPKDSE